jgi:hypothetical protein
MDSRPGNAGCHPVLTVAGSTMVVPARRKSSTAERKMRTISGSVSPARKPDVERRRRCLAARCGPATPCSLVERGRAQRRSPGHWHPRPRSPEDLGASSTVRAIGPAISASEFSGNTPARLVRPIVERIPVSGWWEDGSRMEFPGIAAEADQPEAGRNSGRRAAARSRRRAIQRRGMKRQRFCF